MDRRRFLALVAVASGAIASAAVGIPIIGQLLAPLRRKAVAPGEDFQSLGPLTSFPEGTPQRVALSVVVEDGWETSRQDRSAWVVREGEKVRVLSTVCPHLGCSVKWEAPAGAFKCPCHESAFSPEGAYKHGPARRSMDELPTRISAGDVQARWVDYVANVAERRPVDGTA